MSALRAQVRAESMKFRTGRMWLVIPALLVFSVAVFSGFLALVLTIPEVGNLIGAAGRVTGATRTGLVYSMASSVGYVVPLLLGALLVTGEYRYGTLATTFVVQPRRGIVVVAKLLVVLGAGVIVGLLGVFTSVAVGSGVFSANGVDPLLGDWSTWRIVLGTLVVMPIWAALGMALGLLVRNQAAAIVIALAFTQFVEPLLRTLAWGSDVASALGAYLPGSLTDSIVGAGLYGGVASVGPGVSGIAALVVPPGLALVVLVAYTAILLTVGYRFRWRNDVTD